MMYLMFVLTVGFFTKVAYGIPLEQGLQSRMIGGEDAPEGYSTHMVALLFGSRAQFLMCGGSIISRRLVLTAAHCIEPCIQDDGTLIETLLGRVGSNIWKSGGTIIRFHDYFMHPKWDSDLIKYDAGILVLQEKLDLNDRVGIIGLSYDFVDGGVRSSVTGWGHTGPRIEGNVVHLAPTPDELQLLYVSTLDHEQCQAHMKSVAGDRAKPIQRDVEICTFHSHRHGMCNGDSGSALVQVSTGKQIGIVSWGWNCADGAPDVFVRPYGVRDFIEPIIDLFKD